jgi:uncharacterized membrane protein
MTGPDAPPPVPRRPGRGWRLALFASLALNLMFLGVILGGTRSAPQRPGPGPFGPDMRALWRALPDDARQAMRAGFRDEAGEASRPDRAERRARAAQREAELVALLRAESFDAATFAEMLETHRAAMAARSASAQALLVERIAALPPAERAALADRYEAARHRRLGSR